MLVAILFLALTILIAWLFFEMISNSNNNQHNNEVSKQVELELQQNPSIEKVIELLNTPDTNGRSRLHRVSKEAIFKVIFHEITQLKQNNK
jgi:type II secretory pathway component PulJ